MSQPIKLTKTQKEALTLLAQDKEMVAGEIAGRKFGYETISFLKRRRFVDHKDPNHEPFYSPEILAISKRGREVLEGKITATFKLTKNQEECLNKMSNGKNMLWALNDNYYGFYLDNKPVSPPTITALMQQKLIRVMIKGKRSDSNGNGYTITEKGREILSKR